MPNILTLTAPVPAAPITSATIVESGQVSTTDRSCVLVVRFFGEGPGGRVMYPEPFRMTIRDGTCDCVEVNPNPGTIAHTLFMREKTPEEHAPLATAFDSVMGAYLNAFMTGQNPDTALLSALSALTLLPPGAAS